MCRIVRFKKSRAAFNPLLSASCQGTRTYIVTLALREGLIAHMMFSIVEALVAVAMVAEEEKEEESQTDVCVYIHC